MEGNIAPSLSHVEREKEAMLLCIQGGIGRGIKGLVYPSRVNLVLGLGGVTIIIN